MSAQQTQNSAPSSLCLSTATADQAGRSEHRLSLERTLKNQEHKRHPNELCAMGTSLLPHLPHTSVGRMKLYLSTAQRITGRPVDRSM